VKPERGGLVHGRESWNAADRIATAALQAAFGGGRLLSRFRRAPVTCMSILPIRVVAQPDEESCGATCLEALYRHFGEQTSLPDVVAEVTRIEGGGTLAVHLASHALRRGYDATIYTLSLKIFDPTWFQPGVDLALKLREQRNVKSDPKLLEATSAYLDYLAAGGRILYEPLDEALIRRPLEQGIPILTGLSATYLYGSSREVPKTNEHDDVGGEPVGHFVVVCGYDAKERSVLITDPLEPNPVAIDRVYNVSLDRLIGAICLGIATYDSNLLVISPRKK
jgi:hypothetical protein